MKSPEVSIVIPAYNEEKRIISTLEDYCQFFSKKLKDKFEVIIVPNNCSDKTFEVVQNFAKKNKNVVVLEIKGYSGKGGAVMKGFELAKGDYVGFTDADGSVDARNFFNLIKSVGNSNGVIASRRKKGAVVSGKSLFDNLASFIFNKMVSFLFGFKFRDTQCGAKLFDKKTALFLSKNYSERGWIFDIDILNICKKHNLKILEIPVEWINKAGSKSSFGSRVQSFFEPIRYKFGKKNDKTIC